MRCSQLGFVSVDTTRRHQVEMLLRFGAYALTDDDTEASNKFHATSIDDILMSSTTTVKYNDKQKQASLNDEDDADEDEDNEEEDDADGSGAAATAAAAAGAAAQAGGAAAGAAGDSGDTRATTTFAKATFAVNSADASLDIKDPSFWEKVCWLFVSFVLV